MTGSFPKDLTKILTEPQSTVADELRKSSAQVDAVPGQTFVGSVTMSAPEALKALTQALKADPSYAWSWHCNLAMLAYDAGANHLKANKYAANFMQTMFGIDMLDFAEYRTILNSHQENGTEESLVARDKEGWKEAAIAWEVCASIHEKYAKGKDALYSTKHADYVQHAANARSNLK